MLTSPARAEQLTDERVRRHGVEHVAQLVEVAQLPVHGSAIRSALLDVVPARAFADHVRSAVVSGGGTERPDLAVDVAGRSGALPSTSTGMSMPPSASTMPVRSLAITTRSGS